MKKLLLGVFFLSVAGESVFAKTLHCEDLNMKLIDIVDGKITNRAEKFTGEIYIDYKSDKKLAEVHLKGVIGEGEDERAYEQLLSNCYQWSRPMTKWTYSANISCHK
ncbi:hypothetical protein N9W41_01025, partial [bacterium]|nr:hypothetical protein [bacterium]